MQVQPINNSICFQGKFQTNPLYNKFQEELNPAQKKVFDNIIKRVEKTNDGRIFKFDKVVNPQESDGAEVGIFERVYLIDRTLWMPLFCSTRERAAWCFDQLHNMYKDITIEKFEKLFKEKERII